MFFLQILVNMEANYRRIVMVENRFGIAGNSLQTFGRILFAEGVLGEVCKNKKIKRRQFFLFNDILVYGQILIEKQKFKRQNIIPLQSAYTDSFTQTLFNKYVCTASEIWTCQSVFL